MSAEPHVPVLLDEVIAALVPQSSEVMVDGTLGAGGYARAIVERGASVEGFDRDPDAVASANARADRGIRVHHAAFADMVSVLDADGIDGVDGVVLDIGVSSMQLDQAERGFSFQADGPLDMRMAQDGESAADFVNNADESEIADILYHYGEEPKSRRIARAIVAARPLTRTAELAAVVRKAVGHKPHDKKDPATRAFQAIRIHVNGELDQLAQGLDAAERVLKPGGRLAVVTFHSLEDRIVKRFFNDRSGKRSGGSRHMPEAKGDGREPSFDHVAKPVRAGAAELARNPRARSATLRSAHRTTAPAWGREEAA